MRSEQLTLWQLVICVGRWENSLMQKQLSDLHNMYNYAFPQYFHPLPPLNREATDIVGD